MSKLNCVIAAPIDTYSGYGARSRDLVKSLIEKYPEWDIKILPQRWGNTREGFLTDHNQEQLLSYVVNRLEQSPDIWIQITIPSEFQPLGKFNIGVTAGIETTRADASWIEGCNRMSAVLVSSTHSKRVLEQSAYEIKSGVNTGKTIKLETPVEVLYEGIDPGLYRVLDKADPMFDLEQIVEKELILCVGHWLQGDTYQDRKNLGKTVKTFLETFKNKSNTPALLIKTQGATSSIMDRERILKKIDTIRKTVRGSLPNIYLLHGDLSDSEMNQLYNHPKVKGLISLSKGEGFGRPLLEFSFINKPIIASGWSGQMDFLDPKLTKLLSGTLEQVHPTAVVDKIILRDSQWFEPSSVEVGKAYVDLLKNYKANLIKAKKQGWQNRNNFTIESMSNLLKELLDKHMPPLAVKVDLKLPKLQKII